MLLLGVKCKSCVITEYLNPQQARSVSVTMKTGCMKKRALRGLAALSACFLLCLSLFLSLLPFSAGAEAGQKVVRVGWYESAFNQSDARGRRSGYAYEYQMKIAAYTGWRFEYVEGSWSDLLQMLINGELDIMSDVSYTEERAEHLLYPSVAMGSEEYYLFIGRDNRDISVSDYSTLNGKKVGVNKASIQADRFRDWAEAHGVEYELIELVCSEEESLRMLARGELDAYVTVDSFAAVYTTEETRPVPVCRVGSSDFFFAVPKSRPDLLLELESAMNRIQEENRYYNQQLFEKHLVTTGANAFLTVEEKAWLDSHGPIRIGYQDNYLAFCAKDPATGQLTGALKDYLAKAAVCVMNARIDFEPVAYDTAADAIAALQRGEVDCVFPANLSAGDGEALGLFLTPPLMRTDIFAVVRQSDRQLFSGRDHVVVAVNRGNPNYESCLYDNFPSWQVVVYPTTADCLKAVSDRVADCVLISSYRYNNIARECERMRLTTVDTGAEIDYSFAVPTGNPPLYSILSRVADLVPNAAVTTALTHYIAEDARSTFSDFLAENFPVVAIVCGALLLVFLFLMIRSMKAHRKAARLISATETDALTGLYNREFFLQYAGRMRHAHPDTAMDAAVINIDRFHSVNALNGRDFGDQVLRSLGSELKSVALECGGIAGRFDADRFDLFIRPPEDWRALYSRLQGRVEAISPSAGIRLRMGVMPWRRDLDAVQTFDKARVACSLARQDFNGHLVIFDEKMQEREDYEQRLLSDLHRALNSYEFEVYYQPQYDIRSDPPRFVSAEALVRWNHPELGMISPADFVPLFERHGKIGEVDRFVWSEAARQIARWRDVFGVTVPVSVNLSRVDVSDPALESALDSLLAYNGLGCCNLRLEVTESAYTTDASHVVRVVESLRRKGYVVEMDDFGTGYSSLNMLSAMPVDVLKMDRAFIRRLGEEEKDNSLVALILGIAKSLKIPVVAEGVETEGQLRILRELGCPLVQGFYFSKPLPADEFEKKVIRQMRNTGEKEDGACTP